MVKRVKGVRPRVLLKVRPRPSEVGSSGQGAFPPDYGRANVALRWAGCLGSPQGTKGKLPEQAHAEPHPGAASSAVVTWRMIRALGTRLIARSYDHMIYGPMI